MRIIIGRCTDEYDQILKNDDIVVVPEFFCSFDDWSIYYKLVQEMRESQTTGNFKNSDWISWYLNFNSFKIQN